MRDYFGGHNHTEFSNVKIIDSINRVNRVIDYAWDLNMSGVAITEHDCLSGTIKTIDAYKKKLEIEWKKLNPEKDMPSYEEMSKELDFKVVLGNEIYLSPEGLEESSCEYHFWHLILIAKDEEGFNQIRKLSSEAWKRAWFRGILRTPTYPSDLLKFVEGGHLICSTACLGGYAAWCWKQYISATDDPNADEWDLDYEFIDGKKIIKDKKYYIDKLDNHLANMENLF